jgi:hypothetical protein
MHVEVNEENIALYELERLTGNPKHILLENARQALNNGHVLYCQIPDELHHVNAFENFGSKPAPKVEVDSVIVEDLNGNTIRIDTEGAEIVMGEVVDDED